MTMQPCIHKPAFEAKTQQRAV